MMERVRQSVAGVLETMAARLVTQPRDIESSRLPYTGRTIAGVPVNADNLLTLPAAWRAVAFLSQTVAVMPWHVMRDGEKGAEVATSHGCDYLLCRRPAPEWSSFQFRETLTHWAVRWGNGYAEIEPDQLGRPFAMWPIHPERVEVCRADKPELDDYGEVIASGELFYEVSLGNGRTISLKAKRIFHIRGFGEGPVGVSVIQYAAQSIGWARAVQIFGASFFGNGANIAQVVINKKPLKPDGLKRQKAEFEGLYKGPTRANKTAHLDNDADIKQIGLDAEKTQLNETDQARVLDQCRWIGVPPHKVYDLSRAHFTNLEQQNTESVVDSVMPWTKRFEDEADYKLFGAQNRNGFYTKINLRALMRGDITARIAYYKGMWSMGAYSPNRILELEDENTIGDQGDVHLVQGQNVPLDQVSRQPVEDAEDVDPAIEEIERSLASSRQEPINV